MITIVIPAFNEERTVASLLQKVIRLNLDKEVIVIDDKSSDRTAEIVRSFADGNPGIRFLRNDINLGKSRTVKRGIGLSRGDEVIIQDADLEYAPEDVVNMLAFMKANDLDVVYGNRYTETNPRGYWRYFWGNRLLSFFSNLFTFPRVRKWIPDMEVCYKLVRGDVMRHVGATLRSSSSFGIEPEITAKLSRYKIDGKSLRFGVVPVGYIPRRIAEGKHIKAVDGLKAFAEILKFNL